MTREPIYAAIFAKISSLTGIKTASRFLKHWSDVPVADQPAVFQSQTGEEPKQQRGLPAVWTLNVNIYVYVNTGGDTTRTPSTVLNGIIDQIEAAFPPEPTEGVQTLGDLVSHAWISGKIETDEGTLGDQAVAIIPISVLTAN